MPTYNGTSGGDSYWGGPDADQINGNGGDDYLLGNGGDDEINGGEGNDNLHGGDGDDVLDGGVGSDWLQGNYGVNILRGMAGDDRLLVHTSVSAGELFDGGEGIDTLQFDAGMSASITFSIAVPAVAQDLYGATVVNVEKVSFRSGSGNDDITGGALDDYIDGFSGNDRIDGGLGNDNLDGGFGTDTIYGGGGNDSIRGGSGGLNDLLYGGEGDDTFFWNQDALIEGGAGVDELRIEYYSSTGITADLSNPNVETLILGTRVIGVERLWFYAGSGDDNITGGTGNDSLTGYGGQDILSGGTGDDSLSGGDGDDSLNGGAGMDTMEGGTGNDTFVVDASSDQTVEFVNEGIDLVLASVTHTLQANVENMTLTGSGSIGGTGNTLNNVITGNNGSNRLKGLAGNDNLIGNGGNDTLDGGTGADTMSGGAGNDIYMVDNAGDVVSELAAQGTDTVTSSISYMLGANVENLTLTGRGSVNGTGNELANQITGSAGANILSGRAGNDRLIGGAGNDTLYGEDDNDTLEGGAGYDQLYGGAGADRVQFRLIDVAKTSQTSHDTVQDFSRGQGDRIALDLIDANSGLAGNQAFAFIGNGAFSATAGELRYQVIGGKTFIQGDTNGDGLADFWIGVTGAQGFVSTDILL